MLKNKNKFLSDEELLDCLYELLNYKTYENII